ncbi:MAG: DNA repair protein RadC [Gemmatimonadetes bacterium]|nr:DNA repair protein RadC [Gemmatimonadota bacterium]
MRDFPAEERPRERLRSYGPGHLTNAELMAILLRSGLVGENVLAMATRLLARFGGLDGIARAGYDELCAEKGVSHAKACQILAALELGRRFASLAPADRPAVGSPQDVANMLMPEMSMLEQEHFRVVLLNAKNHVLGVQPVYIGNVDSAVVRPAEVFTEAVRRTCPRVVIVHNHPSGDPTPSPEDVDITKRIIEAGRVLDIDVLDHIVIGRQRFVSMKERKLGFE